MTTGRWKLWTALGGVLAVAGSGCGGRAWMPEPTPVVESDGEAAASPNGGLSLFGMGDLAADVAFEGRAAVDIRQHTPVAEGTDFDPDVDPTGKQLVFASTRHSRHSRLYLKPIDGVTLTQLTAEPADDVQPVFAPCGKRIAFASNRAGQWDIWVVDTNGRNPLQVTNTPETELHPSWSPEGKRLVYCRLLGPDQSPELWIANLENPGTCRLIGEGLFPEWSPLGDKIVYQRARERDGRWFSIWTLEIHDDEVLYPTEVASRTDAALIAPTWSPDGLQIAFAAVAPVMPTADNGRATGRAGIGIVDADGRGFQRLTGLYGEGYSPCWSVDGRIYFTSRQRDSETIWSVRPYRPPLFIEPPAGPQDRRAASASLPDEAEDKD